jgi:hypothetical protein
MFTHADAVFQAQEKTELEKTLSAVEKMKEESRSIFNPVFLEAHGISLLEKLVRKQNLKRLSEKRKAQRREKKLNEKLFN